MTGRPVWFLDIDGVVNFFPERNRPLPPGTQKDAVMATHPSGERVPLPLTWRTSVVDFINRTSREGMAEVVWLTTWGKQAATIFAPAVGLDDFTVAGEVPTTGASTLARSPNWWKLAALRDHLPRGSRFVFTDDDLNATARRVLRGWFEQEDMLLITTFDSVGLTGLDIERITDFIQEG